MEEAIGIKNKGNDAFKHQDWPGALALYSEAIEKYDQEPSFFTNRAQVCRFSPSAHCWNNTWNNTDLEMSRRI